MISRIAFIISRCISIMSAFILGSIGTGAICGGCSASSAY